MDQVRLADGRRGLFRVAPGAEIAGVGNGRTMDGFSGGPGRSGEVGWLSLQGSELPGGRAL